MHLFERRLAGILILVSVLAVNCSCKQEGETQEVRRDVEHFEYSFGLEYNVVKQAAYCSIGQRDLWTDSQVPPPADFDEAPYLLLISQGDCNQLEKLIGAIDWSQYQNLTDSDFEPTPPGMQYRERLFVRIGGDTIVDWIKSYHKLVEHLRGPLEAIDRAIAEIAEQRRANPVLPNDFSLLLSTNGAADNESWRWNFSGGSCTVTLNDQARQLDVAHFAPLWKSLLQLRLLGAEYAPTSAAETAETAGGSDALSVTVNGVTLIDFSFERPYENQGRVEKLRSLLGQALGR